MGSVVRRLADVALVTSDNPRSEDPAAIIADITAGFDMDVEVDRRAAIARAVGTAEPDDVVVIAGKGHEQGQELAGRTIAFDDREVAREALTALAGAT
jgi:UDP-N-acetylmuramoyl-L-alanyl-D-glutamate--2,6-diaminopimelate ligase